MYIVLTSSYKEPVYSWRYKANFMLPWLQSYEHDVLRVFSQDWSVKSRGAWRDIPNKLVKHCNLFRINMLCKIKISDIIITYLRIILTLLNLLTLLTYVLYLLYLTYLLHLLNLLYLLTWLTLLTLLTYLTYFTYLTYYTYVILLQLGFYSVAVVLTLVQTKQIRINIHKRNNTKTCYKQYKIQ